MNNLTNRQKQAIETKRKIYNHAINLFSEKGFKKVKVSDICKSADVSVGVFYHYFKSKEEVLNESYEHVFNEITNETLKLKDAKAVNKIREALSLYAKRITYRGVKYTEIFLNNELSKKSEIFSTKNNLLGFIETLVKEAIIKKELFGDEKEISLSLFKSARGNTYIWVLKSDTMNLEKEILESTDILLKFYSQEHK